MYNFLKRASLTDFISDPKALAEVLDMVKYNEAANKLPSWANKILPGAITNEVADFYFDTPKVSTRLSQILPKIYARKRQQLSQQVGNNFSTYFKNNVKGWDRLRYFFSKLRAHFGGKESKFSQDIDNKFKETYLPNVTTDLTDFMKDVVMKVNDGELNTDAQLNNYIKTLDIPKSSGGLSNIVANQVTKDINNFDKNFTPSMIKEKLNTYYKKSFEKVATTTPSTSESPRGVTGGKLPMISSPKSSAHAENMQGNMAAANRWAFRNGVSANHERFRHAVADNKKYFSRGAGMGLTGKSNSNGGFEYANAPSTAYYYDPNDLGYATAFNIPGSRSDIGSIFRRYFGNKLMPNTTNTSPNIEANNIPNIAYDINNISDNNNPSTINNFINNPAWDNNITPQQAQEIVNEYEKGAFSHPEIVKRIEALAKKFNIALN